MNAAILALIDAGIAMKDFPVAISAGFLTSGKVGIDLLDSEEGRKMTGKCDFNLMYNTKEEKIAHIELDSKKISIPETKLLIDSAIEGCNQIKAQMDELLRRNIESKLM